MALREVWVDSHEAADRVREALSTRRCVAMIELPSVFGLFAAPTRVGAAALDAAKGRLPGKNYGSVIGDATRFASLAVRDGLPRELGEPSSWGWLEGSFIRLSVGPASLNTPAIRDGTHQGLLLSDGPLRRLFAALEQDGLGGRDDLFGDLRHDALLGTSANPSGHPDGSITSLERARAFADDVGLDLMIRVPAEDGPRGSFPIVWFRGQSAQIERRGPGVEALEQALAARGLGP